MVEYIRYDLDDIFGALADPTRRAILRSVCRRRRRVTDIAAPFRMSLAAVSKHLKVLERARLVRRERHGVVHYVSLNAGALKTAEQWIDYYRQFWEQRLDSLKNLLEEEK